MASVAFQLIEEVTAHAQSDCLEDAREICADGTYFPNNLRIKIRASIIYFIEYLLTQNYDALSRPTLLFFGISRTVL